jgi:hypothetical protein
LQDYFFNNRQVISPKAPMWTLPNELLWMVAEFLVNQDLTTLSRVCYKFGEIACSLYMARHGLRVRDDLLYVHAGYSALPIWRRTSAFHPLNILSCWFSVRTMDAELQMGHLTTLFQSLPPSTPSFRHIYLHWMASTVPHGLTALLRSIHRTGCETLSLFGFKGSGEEHTCVPNPNSTSLFQLRSLTVFSTAIHHSPVSSFISTALFHSYLRELDLEDTDLTAVQWSRFLPQLTMPALEALGVDANVKLATLSKFIQRHPTIQDLSVRASTMPCRQSTSLYYMHMPNLESLRGPASYIRAIIQSLQSPPHLYVLTIVPDSFTCHPVSYCNAILCCLRLCASVNSLRFEVPQDMGVDPLVHFCVDFPAISTIGTLAVTFQQFPSDQVMVCFCTGYSYTLCSSIVALGRVDVMGITVFHAQTSVPSRASCTPAAWLR